MTGKQKFIKLIYPIIETVGKIFKVNSKILSSQTKSLTSFYDLKATANDGSLIDFANFKNKKVLIVNTASDCGYTPQYKDLEKLHLQKKDTLILLAFPANNFMAQEKGSDEAIANFCETNFAITFPLMRKTSVLKNEAQSNVYQWLTEKEKNGWNTKEPSWNFCKYLINEEGNLTHFFEASVSPMSKEILNNL